MSLFSAMNISAGGLTAERRRFEVAYMNLINSSTTRTAEGGPYRRKDVVFQTTTFEGTMQEADGRLQGVEVAGVLDDMSPFERVYDPGHPDAVDDYVSYPNVKTSEEMMNMMAAKSSYEANIAAISILKTMINRTLDLGK
jgi:flagellar basal-body rod protein FlgC